MGRASRWLRNLLGGKKSTEDQPERQKKGWGFVKTFQKDRPPTAAVVSREEQSMRVTAVADARAAAAMALLTTSGRPTRMKMEKRAAVKIQSAFRGYLARRALRALKGLVKIQALVRGNIVRKQAAETLRCMKALVRAQTRARAFRALHSDTAPSKSSRSYPCPATPENYESISSKWIEEPSWNMREASKSMDDEKNAKILEVDSGKSRFYSRRGISLGHLHSDRSPGSLTAGPDSLSKGSTTPTQLSTPSTSPFNRRLHKNPLQRFSAADSLESPRFCSPSSQSGSSRRGPFTPAKSKYSPNSINGCSNHPSYMAKTESSAAKSRSQSAPRQRPECGNTGSMRRLPAHELGDRALRSSTPKGKAYPGSGRLDRFGMPMGM